MKTRFSSIDICSVVMEIRNKYQGMRVANVYDIDNKTYLIKLQKPDLKAMILLESGIRLHSTDFEWPKNMMPSGFSMKLRKHLRTRRLETIQQLGMDRIVDLQFGSGDAAYHVIVEMYDRGNMILTDHEYTILNLLRARTDESQDVRFAVRETYPVNVAREHHGLLPHERLMAILLNAKEGDNLKKLLNPHLVYGPALIEHSLLTAGIPANARIGKEFTVAEDMAKLMSAMETAENVLQKAASSHSKGYIVQKREKKADIAGQEGGELLTYQEFHPVLYKQYENSPHIELDTFDKVVDEFFSKIGSQKLDMKALQQEKAALKKLDNVKKDHEKRIVALRTEQDVDQVKAQLVETNLNLVDRAIMVVNTALANQLSWPDIEQLVKEAQVQGDVVALSIKGLKLQANHITMLLNDPYSEDLDDTDEDYVKPMKVDIDLALSAYANARKYYDAKRTAVKKEHKTLEASGKALKSAEKKTKQALKEMQTTASINKARKTYWYEKFQWFITSENYVVIGGRDQQQNELIVKKYMNQNDIYVHADLHGASTCVIKNPSGDPIPPKSLNEAGTMAICNSAAWDARVVTSAWWVYPSQVSKTAPTGEYLTTGSFMIRGKKNYLPPSYLVYGFGILFKLDETSIFRHKGERRVKTIEDDDSSVADSGSADISDVTSVTEEGEELQEISDDTDSDDDSPRQEQENGVEGLETIVEDANDTETVEVSCIKDEVDTQTEEMEGLSVSGQVMAEGSVVRENDEDSDSEEGEALFPDTSLELQHVKGGKFTLQRGERSVSQSSQQSQASQEETSAEAEGVKKERMSAKQRRELKKQKKQANKGIEENVETQNITSENNIEAEDREPHERSKEQKKQTQEQSFEPQQQPKRGQKAKMKKIKKKYADQDEEERELRMELLASAGGNKQERKKDKKKNKQKEQQAQRKQAQKSGPSQAQKPGKGRLTLEDILVTTPSGEPGESQEKNEPSVQKEENVESDEEKEAILEEENIQLTKDADILDSLTGQPVPDDLLLFAIPVCAPYGALVNYRYKVKLTPGTTKRGKAAKIALHMFSQDKQTSQREKDLFKSLKDVDLSRNMPGKVKVSAPNIQKSKKTK